jgi:hypothetical protein
MLCLNSNPGFAAPIGTAYAPYFACLCSQSVSFFSALLECSSYAQALGVSSIVSDLQINAEACNPGAQQSVTSTGVGTINLFPTATTRMSAAVASSTAESAGQRVAVGWDLMSGLSVLVLFLVGIWWG